ncbi:MAG: hypothetical protein B193_1055 [Solidesulfovibrio magneticus str. Maddingley MBC34]|uniref:Methyltransferase domain-containing protein n=1 Tax=Solidesulfovibrio magneticus str. Maddingley MBC34 TaxID=1206767 RepID=K6GTE9_9BACT|nr:MAG: hypothetical protein B193_1055 [Solidesulfovibrio magneticus str. Maddingley MBC34]
MHDDVARFDARAAAWDASPHRRKLAHDIVAAMEAAGLFRQPVASALDFGCGTGLLTLELAERCQTVTGLDNSPGMLAELSAKIERAGLPNVGVLEADLAAGTPVPGGYDFVASAMALHHVPEPEPVLKRLLAAAAPGARFALADLDAEDGSFHDDPAGVHHNGFDRIDLADMLAGLGYTDINAVDAATIVKPTKCCGDQPFGVFLMTARKPG